MWVEHRTSLVYVLIRSVMQVIQKRPFTLYMELTSIEPWAINTCDLSQNMMLEYLINGWYISFIKTNLTSYTRWPQENPASYNRCCYMRQHIVIGQINPGSASGLVLQHVRNKI